MSGAQKASKSVPISQTVTVNTGEVSVVVGGLDRTAIAGSFSVHLMKDGQRIASRFFFQPSEGAEAVESDRFAHFDFLLPIDVVADGKLRVEIEPLEPPVSGKFPRPEQMGRPTLSVYLMLERA